MPAGRPSKYDPAFCERVIELMSEGLSLTAVAGELDVARSTINEWIDNHPEFSEACKRGQGKRTAFLERQMLQMENGPAVTARIFALKNAAPEEWRDKQNVEHSGEIVQRIERVVRDA